MAELKGKIIHTVSKIHKEKPRRLVIISSLAGFLTPESLKEMIIEAITINGEVK